MQRIESSNASHMRRPCRTAVVRGFTLIELLVCISLITLLMALLLPALAESRQATFRATCLSQMRQVGITMGIYVNDFNDCIPPNANAPDNPASGNLCAFKKLVNTGHVYYTMEPSDGGSLRDETSLSGADTTGLNWNGLGLMWAMGYLPWSKDGAKLYWCPAEFRNSYERSNSNGYSTWGPGPATYFFFGGQGFAGRPFMGGSNVNKNAYCSYSYRCLGNRNATLTLNRGSFIYSNLGKYVSVIDDCSNIAGTGTSAARKDVYSHGASGYIGFNRLWYDGHAKWFNDPSIVWSQVGGNSLSGSNSYPSNTGASGSAWTLYDN